MLFFSKISNFTFVVYFLFKTLIFLCIFSLISKARMPNPALKTLLTRWKLQKYMSSFVNASINKTEKFLETSLSELVNIIPKNCPDDRKILKSKYMAFKKEKVRKANQFLLIKFFF